MVPTLQKPEVPVTTDRQLQMLRLLFLSLEATGISAD